MKVFEKAIANAFVVAGIALFSTLSVNWPPTMQNLWASGIAFSLALLTQLNKLTDTSQEEKPKKPLGMLF